MQTRTGFGLLAWLLMGLGMTLAGAGRAQAVYVPLSAQSPQVVYASKTGAKLDSNLQTGGGTDDTAALQAILNKASTGKPIKLIVDGVALVTGLNVYSNTTIECLPGGGFFLKAQSNKPILSNVHKTSGTIVDHDITLTGGVYNANGLPDSSGNVNGNQQKFTSYNAAAQTGGWTVGLGFYGVDGLTLQNLTVLYPRTYCWQIADWKHVTVSNVRLDVGVTNGINYDGAHFNGPGQWATLHNLTVHAWDDSLGINADDEADTTSRTPSDSAYGVPWVTNGAITDVDVDGLHLDGSLYGLRLLSGNSRVDRINVRNVTGTVTDYAAVIDCFDGSFGGPGNFGSILLDGFNVQGTGAAAGSSYSLGLINLGANIENISLNNVARQNPTNPKPTLYVRPGYTLGTVSLSNLSLRDSTAGQGNLNQIWNRSTISQLRLSGVNWLKTNGGTGNLIQNDGTVSDFGMSGYSGPASILAGTAAVAQHGDAFASNITTPAVTLTTGLLTYYKLDEATGQLRTDSSSNGWSLTDVGGATQVTGLLNKGAHLTAASHQYLTDTVTTHNQIASGSFTTAGWVKYDSLSDIEMLASKGDGGSNNEFILYLAPTSGNVWNQVNIAYNNSAGVQAGVALPGGTLTPGQWAFVATGRDSAAGTVWLSVNGGTRVTASLAGAINTTTAPFRLGYWTGSASYYLDGALDGWGTWSRSLSPAEITTLYNAGAGKDYPFN